MTGAWKLCRNRYGRAIYDRLQEYGVTATLMTRFTASLPLDTNSTAATKCTVEVANPDRVTTLDAPVGELRANEVVVAAFDGRDAVGYLFCSLDSTHTIAPLERTLSFDGAYIRRVFVHPEHRNRGVATALVAQACAWASEQGARNATALVARDNVPSRRLFAREGFEPASSHVYIRLGPFSYRRAY
jgi:GNAT superfamily N-acetyltransferase